MTAADILRNAYAAEAPEQTFTAWLAELTAWLGVSNSTAWAWLNGSRGMPPTVKKLIHLRSRISPELRREVAEI